jgi:pimeloyl-ACP methyl ester carboxylesterase
MRTNYDPKSESDERQQQMKVRAGEISLNYETYGDGGDWVVMCHGLGAGLRSMRNAAEQLANRYRVLIWDNRGIGESDTAPPGGDYSIATHARDLANLMDALGIDRAIVHGSSWGGVLSQRFAIDFPEKVRALIIDSSSAEVNEAASKNWIARGEAYAREGPAGLRNAPGGLRGAEEAASQPAPPRAGAGGGIAADPTAYLETCRAVASLYERPMTDELVKIKAPTLAIVGENDRTAGVGGTVKLSRVIPDCKLVILKDTGHGVYAQNPDAFFAELDQLAARTR